MFPIRDRARAFPRAAGVMEWLSLVALCAGGLTSCSSACSMEDNLVRFTGGRTDPSRSFYQTSGFNEAFLDFPAGRKYELLHGLKSAPDHVAIFLSFAEKPLSSGSNLALAAGNQAVIERVDDTVVWVRNDTCAHYYLRVELSTVAWDAGADAAGGG